MIWVRRTVLILALVAVLAAAGLTIALPAAAAYACPACYGMAQVAPNLWAAGGTEARRAALPDLLREAKGRVAAFWGKAPDVPVLACLDQRCADRLDVKKARGMAYGSRFLVMTPRGLGDPTYLAHELDHIAFHGLIGFENQMRGAVPAWFDEGLAVIVSQDPRAPARWGQPCPLPVSALPSDARAWRHEAGKPDAHLYAAAACQTGAWLARHGGKAGLMEAIATIRKGGDLPL